MDALAAVFSPRTDAAEKMRALESQLGPEAAGRLKGDVKRMGSLEDYAIEIGVERGIQKGIKQGIEQGIEKGRKEGFEEGSEKTMLKNIATLMENLSVSADEAFRMLGVPKDKQMAFRTKLALR